MSFIPTLLAGIAFPAPPTLLGWSVWVFLLAVLVYALFRWKAHQPVWKGREWGFFGTTAKVTMRQGNPGAISSAGQVS